LRYEQSIMRVEIKPELLRWARERSMIDPATLAERFPRLDAWEQGHLQPTLKQLEDFANATHAPDWLLLSFGAAGGADADPGFQDRRGPARRSAQS
jgi:hypothetical protein